MFRPFRQATTAPTAQSASEKDAMGTQEQTFGLCLRGNGTWQRHKKTASVPEAEEPAPGSAYDAVSTWPKPLRRLTNFALYDAEGRLVPLEILNLAGVGEISAFGTLLAPPPAASLRPTLPFPMQEDQIASLVLLSQTGHVLPIPPFEPEAPSIAKQDLDQDEIKLLLEQLPFAPITRQALLDSEIGKRVQRASALENDARFADISRLAKLVKQAWRDVLEQGGCEPASVNPDFLAHCASKLDAFLDQAPVVAAAAAAADEGNVKQSLSPVPIAPLFSSTAAPPAAAASTSHGEEGVDFENLKRLKRVRKVDSSELIPEYEWTGTGVEPAGPHAEKLIEMIHFLRQMGKREAELLGWRLNVSRKSNLSHGEYDYTVFVSPNGIRYRSRAEVGRAFKTAENAAAAPSTTNASAASANKTPTKSASAAPTATTATAAAAASTAAVMPSRPPFASYFSPPTALLFPAEDAVAPAAATMDGGDVDMLENGATSASMRVKLVPTGWSFSDDAVLLHTRTAVYFLERPASYYRGMYCNAFLLFDACRSINRIARANILQGASFNQIIANVLMRADLCPGKSEQDVLTIPDTARAFYYFTLDDRLTFDFIVAHEPRISQLCSHHASLESFFQELKMEHGFRKQRARPYVQLALQLDEERKLALQRRAAQNEAKLKDRIGILARRIEVETDLPDDYLVERLPMSELVKTTSQDPLVHLALEKVLSKVLPVRGTRPSGIALVDDPAHFSGFSPQSSMAGAPPARPPPSLPQKPCVTGTELDKNRALFSGSLREECAFARPNAFGEIFARLVNVWEASCLFARCTPTLQEETLVAFRKQVYGYGNADNISELFATMLRAIARDEFARLAQPALWDDVPSPGAELLNEGGCAYDLSVWPLPEFAISARTWPLALRAALVHHLQTNVDACALEAFECGEWSPPPRHEDGASSSSSPASEPPPLFALAKPELDLIALCDDGLRRLLAEADSEDFFKPDPTTTSGVNETGEASGATASNSSRRPALDLGEIRARIKSGYYTPGSVERAPPTTMPIAEMLECLASFRQGMQVVEKKPDCGKCKNCLEKPRFGGINLLRSNVCMVRQHAEQSAFAGGTGGGSNAQAIRTQLKAKKRALDASIEERFLKWDEAVYERDAEMGGRGGGHEAIAADVRHVFRQCKLNHKGNGPLLKAAAKLEALFFAFYFRFVACRDARYVPENRQVLRLPPALLRDEGCFVPRITAPEDSSAPLTVPPRNRVGFPSLVQCVKAIKAAPTADFLELDIQVKLVALDWLVNRALDCVSPEVFTPAMEVEIYHAGGGVSAAAAAAKNAAAQAAAAKCYQPLFSGLTRDYWRVYASVRMVRETGGLILMEDLKTGEWRALSTFAQVEELIASLDARGKRECLLKRHLETNLEALKQVMAQCLKELAAAPAQFKTAEQDLHTASKELAQLKDLVLPRVSASAQTARAARQAKHDAAELERKRSLEKARAMWKETKNAEGRPYYYHSDKRPPVWEKPKEMTAVFVPEPFNEAEDALTPEEVELNTVKRKMDQLQVTIDLCASRWVFCQNLLLRDRYVLLGEDGLKKPKQQPPPQQPASSFIPLLPPAAGGAGGKRENAKEGVLNMRTLLLVDMLALEHVALGPGADTFLGANLEWRDKPRLAWVETCMRLAKDHHPRRISAETTSERLGALRELLTTLFECFTMAQPLGFELQREEWRWITSVRTAQTVADLGLAFVHLARFVQPKLSAGAVEAQAAHATRLKKDIFLLPAITSAAQ